MDERSRVEKFLRTRDEAEFRALYRDHAPAMFGLLLRLNGGSAEDAEDVLQEAWMRAVARLHEFRWESSLRTWLCAIAVRTGMEHSRKRQRTVMPVAESHLGISAEAATGLRDAVAALADGYREVLVLHDVEGYTHREIADLLGIEEGTSKSQLSRARRAIRDALAAK